MADITVNLPHGGGSMSTGSNTYSHSSKTQNGSYLWLGGTGESKNLFISARLQNAPNFLIVDIYTQGLRNTGSDDKALIQSKMHSLSGEAGSRSSNHTRDMRLEKLNSTTALMKLPKDSNTSTYYVIEITNEANGDHTIYHFDNSKWGGHDQNYRYPYQVQHMYQMFMHNVEENVVVSYERKSNSECCLVQNVWDPVAKTLTPTNVVSTRNNDPAYVDIDNFYPGTNIMMPLYGDSNDENSTSIGNFNSLSPGLNYSQSPGSNCSFPTVAEGRDGKIYIRFTNGPGVQQIANVYGPESTCFVYIPGGDKATSGMSTSWGLASGLKADPYGTFNNQGRFGHFLPLLVEPVNLSSSYDHQNGLQRFFIKNWLEVGPRHFKVHTDGTDNGAMAYNPSSQSSSDNHQVKQCMWLDSNHFFVHWHEALETASGNYWGEQNYDKYVIQQYVDESYSVNVEDSYINSYYNSMSPNSTNHWQKIDDYSLICRGFDKVLTIWAPE